MTSGENEPGDSLTFEFNHEKLIEENQQSIDHLSIVNLSSFISDMQQGSSTNILISEIYENFSVLANNQLLISHIIEYFYQKLSIDILDHPENQDIRNKLEDYLVTNNYLCETWQPYIIESLIEHFILEPLEKSSNHEPEKIRQLFELVFPDNNNTLLNFIVEKSSPKQLERTFEIAFKVFSSSDKNEYFTSSSNVGGKNEPAPLTGLPRFYAWLLNNTTSNGNILCSTIRSAKTRNLIIILDILSKVSNVFEIISFFQNDDLNKCPLNMISTLPETTNNNHIRSIFANFLKRHFIFPENLNTDRAIIEYTRDNYSLLQKSDFTYTPPTKPTFTYTYCLGTSENPLLTASATYAPLSSYGVTSIDLYSAPPPSYESTQAQRSNSSSFYPLTQIVDHYPYDVTSVGMRSAPPPSYQRPHYEVTSVGTRPAPPSYQDTFPEAPRSRRLRTAPALPKSSSFNINAAPYTPKQPTLEEEQNLKPSSDSNANSLPLTADTHASSTPPSQHSRNIITRVVPDLRAHATDGNTKIPLPRSSQGQGDSHTRALETKRSAFSSTQIRK